MDGLQITRGQGNDQQTMGKHQRQRYVDNLSRMGQKNWLGTTERGNALSEELRPIRRNCSSSWSDALMTKQGLTEFKNISCFVENTHSVQF